MGTRHGVLLNLAVVDPVFAPAVAAMGRLRAIRGAVESGDPRCAPTLRSVAGVLTRDTYTSVGVLLSKGFEVSVNDEQVARAWDFVQDEPARRGSSDVRLRLDLPPGLAVKGRAGDLHDILANLLRNSMEAGASRVEVSAEVEEDWVTGLEQICVRVADDVPSGLTTEHLRSRFVARGLGLVVDLVHRFRGSVCVEPRADYAKCVAVRLPRAEPIRQEPTS